MSAFVQRTVFSLQMKSPTASGATGTWWWTGPTKPRASPTSHLKVLTASTAVCVIRVNRVILNV